MGSTAKSGLAYVASLDEPKRAALDSLLAETKCPDVETLVEHLLRDAIAARLKAKAALPARKAVKDARFAALWAEVIAQAVTRTPAATWLELDEMGGSAQALSGWPKSRQGHSRLRIDRVEMADERGMVTAESVTAWAVGAAQPGGRRCVKTN